MAKVPWIWLYALLMAAWTYACTRGRDGHLMATLVGFGVLGTLYWLTLCELRPITVGALLWHLVVFEFAVMVALLVNPQLDEMGGILNLWIPFLVLAIVLGGLILSWWL